MPSSPFDLRTRCLEAEKAYRQGKSLDRSPCLELFRLAIVLRNDDAWAILLEIYHPQVATWVNGHPLRYQVLETTETLVHHAWTRFWHALSPKRFAQREGWTLPHLMLFLKRCVDSAVRDAARRERRKRRIIPLEDVNPSVPNPSTDILQRMSREELWDAIVPLLKDDRERLVMELRYRQGIPPRKIIALYPDVFLDAEEVSRILRNIIRRLKRYFDKDSDEE